MGLLDWFKSRPKPEAPLEPDLREDNPITNPDLWIRGKCKCSEKRRRSPRYVQRVTYEPWRRKGFVKVYFVPYIRYECERCGQELQTEGHNANEPVTEGDLDGASQD